MNSGEIYYLASCLPENHKKIYINFPRKFEALTMLYLVTDCIKYFRI